MLHAPLSLLSFCKLLLFKAIPFFRFGTRSKISRISRLCVTRIEKTSRKDPPPFVTELFGDIILIQSSGVSLRQPSVSPKQPFRQPNIRAITGRVSLVRLFSYKFKI